MFEKHITKEQVNELPLFKYEGKVVVVSTQEQLKAALEELNEEPVLGFDTESKPTFRRGQYNHVALIQVAIPGKVFLIRVNYTGFTKELQQLFQDSKIKKVGISIRDDIKDLQKLGDFVPKSVIDLNDIARELEIINSGVRGLCGIFLGIRISKTQQTSNWERETLSESQMSYAATDAWVCLEIYRKLDYLGYLD